MKVLQINLCLNLCLNNEKSFHIFTYSYKGKEQIAFYPVNGQALIYSNTCYLSILRQVSQLSHKLSLYLKK